MVETYLVTNEKLLWIILIVFLVGAAIYFGVTKFKQAVDVTATPSPSPSTLNFLFNQSPPATPAGQQANPQPSELPLTRNKTLAQFPGVLTADVLQNKKAVFLTNKGNFEVEIFPDVPLASSNFLILAANGFYDGLKFHRVEANFVVQGGDPLGDGTGGPGYSFQDEAVTREYNKGIVAMANAGPNTNGSQFFIMLEDHLELPKKYTIFGKVLPGMEVVEKLMVGDIMQRVIVQNLQ